MVNVALMPTMNPVQGSQDNLIIETNASTSPAPASTTSVGNTITTSNVQELDVGKLVAGSITADVLITTGLFRTGTSPDPRIEITSTLIAGYSDATTKQFYLDASTGKAYAGAGAVILDTLGITSDNVTGSDDPWLRLKYEGVLVASMSTTEPVAGSHGILISAAASVSETRFAQMDAYSSDRANGAFAKSSLASDGYATSSLYACHGYNLADYHAMTMIVDADGTMSSVAIRTSCHDATTLEVYIEHGASDKFVRITNADLRIANSSSVEKASIAAATGEATFVGGVNVGSATEATAGEIYVDNGTSEPHIWIHRSISATYKGYYLAVGAAGEFYVCKSVSKAYASIPLAITPDTGEVTFAEVQTLTGATTDGYVSALRLDPGYTAAYTVTRHNYIDLQNVSLAASAAVTNACVFRFDAAIGTHKAVDAASTKSTPSGVDAWLKVNLNGTLGYVPVYLSKTA